ncbi:MAG: hypothetical protein Q8R45_13375 [Brevundimonas sp.]|uniref:hypothetical protein n=1 Tax=Brevundimonas sp. TaxID=1871086 RepID=UPI002736DA15|nr:hypothetical protein [Brevundimonas sp.]MDP3657940.1 hypothetical protein [Brevundimonas sp.]MDZ4059860.1 hypothetical protein [Brevundimonas sp.]
MRRVSLVSTALFVALGATAFAGSSMAQVSRPSSGEAQGLRYLSWSNRAPAAAPADANQPAPARRDLRRPNIVIPHGGFNATEAAPVARPGLTPAPGAPRSLTPANAWMQPRTPTPEPSPPSAPSIAAAETPAPRMTPDYLPDRGGRAQPAPADIAYAPPAGPSGPDGPVDPMAPRRDAPIFRMQQVAPAEPAPVRAEPTVASPATAAPRPRRVAEVANTGESPPQKSARYYSVHRQNGRQPDALDMPRPTYVDALAVTMVETLASQDLAQPEQGPTLIRDAQGRVRAAPAASDGDHQ